MYRLREIKKQLATILADQRIMLDAAEAESRNLTVAEAREYAQLDKRGDELIAEKKQLESNPPARRYVTIDGERHPMQDSRLDAPAFFSGFEEQNQKTEARSINSMRYDAETRAEYAKFGEFCKTNETRTLQKDSDTKGGFTVTPEKVNRDIFHDVDNAVHIKKFARVFRVDSADSFGIPIMDSDVADPDFTGEISEAQLDSSMSFEKRKLYPRRLVKAIKVSRDLLNLSATDFGGFVQQRLAYKIAVAQENAFLTGEGANGPLGLFTVSNQGVSANRNVSAGNSATGIGADGLVNAMYNLKSQYLQSPSCRWIFSRAALKMIRKLKTGEGDYIWRAGLGDDAPPTILGVQYLLSEYCPASFVSGARVGCIADLQCYGIAEVDETRIQVLLEKYALENAIAYIVQTHVDGAPLLEEGFSMVTLA